MTRTGEQLCADTDSAVHRFRMEWVEQLVERFRKNPGRPIVHLSDLLDSTMVGLGTGIGEELQDHCEKLRSLPGSIYERPSFIGIVEAARGKPSRFTRLGSWKLFSSLTGFNVDKLEPYVTRLRISGGRYMRMVDGPKLPFNLATVSGARLVGYQGDANSRNSAFSNKNPLLHEDYGNCVRDVVGNITVTRTMSDHGGFGVGSFIRTNVGKLVTRIVTVAGLDNSLDQKLANNPLPLWLQLCDASAITECLSALWDAEGSVNYHDLKVSQAVHLVESLKERVPFWPSNIPFGDLSQESHGIVLKEPPLLLVSTALLLRKLGIRSRLRPSKLSMTSTGPSVYWQLRVNDVHSIKRFQDQISLVSKHKQDKLSRSGLGIPKRRPVDDD